ncbi:MAG: IS3 family transposase [Dethiosulfatibacter sp.]|nr:IS3 family transposase [Dethiosulfatibacter sp.]
MTRNTTPNTLESFLTYIKAHPSYVSKKVRFSIIKRFHKQISIVKLCRILDVSRSGFYKWSKRIKKESQDEAILRMIIKIQNAHRDSLGYRLMKKALEMKGIMIGYSKTYRIMHRYGKLSKALYTKKNVIINKAIHIYRNQLKGDFSAFYKNLKWSIDITKIDTDEGRYYLYVIIDLYDRYIVHFKFHKSQKTYLVKRMIQEALDLESIDGSIPILIHSDQGVQFSSQQYHQFVKRNNINASMSNKGTPTDNAVIESFFATLKLECIYRTIIESKESAIEIINDFICYYNNVRLQMKTGKTPSEIRFSI